jgi:hypothetical protein
MKDLVENEMRELLEREAKENGKTEDARRPVNLKEYIGGLPYCLRLQWVPDGKYIPESRRIMVNEQFVVNGFSNWIGDIRPKPKERKPNPTKYRLAIRMYCGRLQPVYFEQGLPLPTDPARQVKTQLLPNFYIFENGKLVNTKEKAPRYADHGLVDQLEHTPGSITMGIDVVSIPK